MKKIFSDVFKNRVHLLRSCKINVYIIFIAPSTTKNKTPNGGKKIPAHGRIEYN